MRGRSGQALLFLSEHGLSVSQTDWWELIRVGVGITESKLPRGRMGARRYGWGEGGVMAEFGEEQCRV